jgi:hypothetical protein
MLWCKEPLAAQAKKITPTTADLETIQALALPGFSVDPEALFIGRMSLANDIYDRSHERFPESYLQRFKETIVGKGVMVGHDYTREPAGHFYFAEVGGGTDSKELLPSYYLLESDPLTAKIKAGIARYVSIGFNPDLRLCDFDGKDYDGWSKGEDDPCPHVAGREYDGQLARVTYGGDVAKVEALEGSFVWLGCQYGAQALGANQVLSPEAKAAYFDSREQKGVWQIPLSPGSLPPVITATNTTAQLPLIPYAKEAAMLVSDRSDRTDRTDRSDPSPLSPEQERKIALGEAYVAAMQAHVKSRYGPCGQEKTGEVIAGLFETASAAEIDAAVKAADEVFNERFPGTG